MIPKIPRIKVTSAVCVSQLCPLFSLPLSAEKMETNLFNFFFPVPRLRKKRSLPISESGGKMGRGRQRHPISFPPLLALKRPAEEDKNWASGNERNLFHSSSSSSSFPNFHLSSSRRGPWNSPALPLGHPNCSFPLSLLWGYGTGHGAARGKEKKVWGALCHNYGFPEQRHSSRNEKTKSRQFFLQNFAPISYAELFCSSSLFSSTTAHFLHHGTFITVHPDPAFFFT